MVRPCFNLFAIMSLIHRRLSVLTLSFFAVDLVTATTHFETSRVYRIPQHEGNRIYQDVPTFVIRSLKYSNLSWIFHVCT